MAKQQPRTGDTVRVVLEGPVGVVEDDGFDLGDSLQRNYISPGAVHVKSVEILAPPVKVGDKVTTANVEALPENSVIARAGYHPLIKLGDEWHYVVGRGGDASSQVNGTIAHADAVVLRVGDGQ